MYYIIEHPSRGVLMKVIPCLDTRGMYQKFKCSYNARRTEGMRYLSLENAQQVSSKFKGSYVLRVQTTPKFSITHLDGRRA